MSSSPVTAIVIDSPGGMAALRSRTDTLKVVKLHSKLTDRERRGGWAHERSRFSY
jgi:hypothetical protein